MLELLNTPLGKALLLSRGVILSVLFKIAVLARLSNRLRDPRAIYPLEAL